MGIFRRSRDVSSPSSPAIIEFWSWWSQARPSIEARLEAGLTDPLGEELRGRIHLIDPRLQWEIGRTPDGAPVLTVTGNGDPELRGLAERWLRAAPGKTGWEYRATRPADPERLNRPLTMGDHEFDLEYVRLGMRVDHRQARIDVTVFHPDFLFVSAETRAEVAGRVLAWSLGEDDVVRWVGEVTTVGEAPVDSLPAAMLGAVVQQVAETSLTSTWLTGEGRTPRGHPARVSVRFPLHRQDHLLCDLHVAVSVPFAHSNPDRLPVDPSAKALRDFEKRLTALGDRAVLAAHETGDGLRVFHLYADPDSGAVAELDQLAASWPEGRVKVTSASDPAWRLLRPYLP